MKKFIAKLKNGCKVANRILSSGKGRYMLSVGRYVSEHLEELLQSVPNYNAIRITENQSDINNNNGIRASYQTVTKPHSTEANDVTHAHELSSAAAAHEQVKII